MIENFTKENVVALKKEINSALQKIGEKHGITISTRSATFNPTSTTINVKAAVSDPTGIVWTEDALRYYQLALIDRHLNPNFLFKKFQFGGRFLMIIGWRSRARKYPIILKDAITGGCTKVSYKHLLEVLANVTWVDNPIMPVKPPTASSTSGKRQSAPKPKPQIDQWVEEQQGTMPWF